MPGSIKTTIDHVAIAVPKSELALSRFIGDLGGGLVASGRRSGSTIDQVRFANGAKLELIGPDHSHPHRSRLERFLFEFGSSVHHITLLVQSVAEAIESLEGLGISTVGKSLSDERYQEAFILPISTGGILVQLSWKDVDDEGWAKRHGHKSILPRVNAANFYGTQCSVKNLSSALDVWRILGGKLRKKNNFVDVYWDDSPLIIRLNEGKTREGIQLLFGGCEAFEGNVEMGPAINCPEDLGTRL